MTFYIPAICAFFAFILLVYLLFIDKNTEFNIKVAKMISHTGLDVEASKRLFQVAKGYLLIAALVAILLAIDFYAP